VLVNDVYLYPDFNGVDWSEVGDRYQALVEQGLTDADFYTAMALMIGELGDQHSHFLSPQEVAEEEDRLGAGQELRRHRGVRDALPDDRAPGHRCSRAARPRGGPRPTTC
jgi:hypothetical protein